MDSKEELNELFETVYYWQENSRSKNKIADQNKHLPFTQRNCSQKPLATASKKLKINEM